MIQLEWSEKLGRKIRQEDAPELAIPTWSFLREAIQEGRSQQAFEFMEHCREQDLANNDSLIGFIDSLMSFMAEACGEEALVKALRVRGFPRVKESLSGNPSVLESLQRGSEVQRRHHGNIVSIVEEPERYVMTLDPCGSGGRLRRARKVGTTKKAYPWSWGKRGVPYYCTHCCLQSEVLPIEVRGYPIRVTLVGDKAEDPCVHLYYKRPELIPEEYFSRLGKTKSIK